VNRSISSWAGTRRVLRDRFGRAVGEPTLATGRDVADVEIAVANARDVRAVRGELRIDRIARGALELGDGATRPLDHEQAPGERDEDAPPVLRELVGGDAARRLALTLAARALRPTDSPRGRAGSCPP
jgi:hypothetical protein